MSHINLLGGLKKEFHHIKKQTNESGGDYEPAMVILKHELKGRSFIIPLEAMWKYIDPSDNRDEALLSSDRMEFAKIKAGAIWDLEHPLMPAHRDKAAAGLACCMFAEAFAKGMGFLLCTSWNLAKIMQMMEIPPSPQAAAQLLLWIQDGLDTLKNMPPCPEDEIVGTAGEVTLFADGEKVANKELVITETDIAESRVLQ
jgi:hypothetical protein